MDALNADGTYGMLVDMGFDSDMAHAPSHTDVSGVSKDINTVLTCDLVVQPTHTAKANLMGDDAVVAPMNGMLDMSTSYASSSSASSPVSVSSTAKQTEEERRKKHNANERRRTNALKVSGTLTTHVTGISVSNHPH